MDIVFHYFAVKTIAREAGFEEEDAQRIAKYSQFVDDNNSFRSRTLNNIPADIKNGTIGYDLYDKEAKIAHFDPATTGFSDNIDYAHLELFKSQKFIISPFHFVPYNKNNIDKNDFKTYEATLKDGSFISNQLESAQTEYEGATDSDAKKRALMRIGILLHVFADTYAHAGFSGYASDCNDFGIKSVINNITNADLTEKFKKETSIFAKIAKIGHGGIGHLPDLTFISYELEKSGIVFKRDNTVCFIEAGLQIFKYLKMLKGGEILQDDITNLTKKLTQGFLFEYDNPEDKNDFNKIKTHWEIINNYHYSYDKKEFDIAFFEDFSYTSSYAASDEYYDLNRYADKFLIDLYGKPFPRKG